MLIKQDTKNELHGEKDIKDIIPLLLSLVLWIIFGLGVYYFTQPIQKIINSNNNVSNERTLSVEEKEQLLESIPLSGNSSTPEQKIKLLNSISSQSKTLTPEEKIQLLNSM